MIMTNIGHHGILVLRKFDGINCCDFLYHVVTIISIIASTHKHCNTCT